MAKKKKNTSSQRRAQEKKLRRKKRLEKRVKFGDRKPTRRRRLGSALAVAAVAFSGVS